MFARKIIHFFVILFLFFSNTVLLADWAEDENSLYTFIKNLSPEQRSAIAERIKKEDKIANNQYGILLYEPTYILPFYYTTSPYQQIYQGLTPENQRVMYSEFKAQFSVQVPLISHFLSNDNSLNLAYTQDSFWQVYAQSQYFRETDYAPEIFFRRLQTNNFIWQLGLVHQSNGRGGEYERSWNRAYAEATYSGVNWAVSLKPWALIFQNESSDLHNPDIAHYMGYGEARFLYKIGDTTFSLTTRNNIESQFTRGTEEFSFSFPLHGHFRGYIYAFSGYGQSLIEYNHYTNAYGVGFSFNDWI